MTSLIYEPRTIEYPDCEDCCPQFPVINICPELFPNGVAKYWEFTIPSQGTTGCSCDSLAGVWQLETGKPYWFVDLAQGCTGCFSATSRNISDRVILQCNLVGGRWSFGGWRMCLGSTSQSIGFTPPIPANSIVLSGFISNFGFVHFGFAWFIELINFNPLSSNILTRAVLTIGNTLSFCPNLPTTVTVEPIQ